MSELWSQFAWQQPLWLLLAPLPWLLWLWRKDKTHHPALERFASAALWPRLLHGIDQTLTHRGRWLFFGAWSFAIIAAAGPLWLKSGEQLSAAPVGSNIVVVLDISPSMLVSDVNPNRLELAKRQLLNFIRQRPQDRFALVTFSANAYTVLPLTHDAKALEQFLDALNPELVTVPGTNVNRALVLANKILRRTPGTQNGHGLVLLLSDGEIHDSDGLIAARTLGEQGYPLYTIGVGTTVGGPVPLPNGQLVRQEGEIITSQLQPGVLQRFAEAGHGEYQPLSTAAWSTLARAADQRAQPISERMIRRGTTALFPFFLTAAFTLFLWAGFRRPEALAALLLVPLLLTTPDSEAAPWDELTAYQDLKKQNFEGAMQKYSELDHYSGHLGHGAAAYRLKHWQQALNSFRKAETASRDPQQQAAALHNQGNALAQLNQLDDARVAYQRALQLQPQFPQAAHNLALVNRYLQEHGGTHQSKNLFSRPGIFSDQQQQTGPGSGGDIANRMNGDQSGNDLHRGAERGNGAPTQHQQSIDSTLANWGKISPNATDIPQRTLQQLQNLNEDAKTMLQRRFATEDENTRGMVGVKPW
ncbi:MAG: VWA domain-containing protein [Gammaproteobacteria bacterium]|nr:VWA domain-containing protein [Gammaproteobacteria bacterium]